MNYKQIINNCEKIGKSDIHRIKTYYDSCYYPKELALGRLDGRPRTRSYTNFIRYATSFYCGFCFKNKAKYISKYADTNKESLKQLDYMYRVNNLELGDLNNFRSALLYGYGVEIVSVENQELKIKSVPSEKVWFINDEDKNIKIAIYKVEIPAFSYYSGEFYDQDTVFYYFYDDETIKILDKDGNVLSESAHVFGQIPVIVYRINDQYSTFYSQSLLEQCDQYSVVSSALIDDIKHSADNYLVVKGMDIKSFTQKDKNNFSTYSKLKELGYVSLPAGASAEYISRNIDTDKYISALTNIRENIFRMLSIPDLIDKQSGSQALNSVSGTALRLLFLSMELQASEFIKYFVDGLYKRISLINRYLSLYNMEEILDIDIKIEYNIPNNEIELLQYTNSLKTLMSTKDILSKLKFIDNPEIAYDNFLKEKEESQPNIENNT
jgi:SPP1 family phage portal protein